MSKKLAKLIFLALFLFCSPALADTDVTNQPVTQAYLQAAINYWKVEDPTLTTPCDEQVIVAPLPTLSNYSGVVANPWGATFLYGCTITIDPIAWQIGSSSLCTLIVHEYGHTLGLDDSPSPAIMSNDMYAVDVPTCDQALFGWYGLRPYDKRWLKENGLAVIPKRHPHRCTKKEQAEGYGGWCG